MLLRALNLLVPAGQGAKATSVAAAGGEEAALTGLQNDIASALTDKDKNTLLRHTITRLHRLFPEKASGTTPFYEQRLLGLIEKHGVSSLAELADENDPLTFSLLRYYGRSPEHTIESLTFGYGPEHASRFAQIDDGRGGQAYTGYKPDSTVLRNISITGRTAAVGNFDKNAEAPDYTMKSPLSTTESPGGKEKAYDASILSFRAEPRTENAGRAAAQRNTAPSRSLISRYGNLIEGADPNTPSPQAAFMEDSVERTITELTVKLKRAEEKAEQNSGKLEEIRKKQTELEQTALKNTDLRALSDEVINRLRFQLRMDSSRFSKR